VPGYKNSFNLGQKTGDLLGVLAGGIEDVIGGGGEVAGVGLDLTGVGSAVGIPLGAASTGLIIHGSLTIRTSVENFLKVEQIQDDVNGNPSSNGSGGSPPYSKEPPGTDKVKLKNGQGWRDSNGNIWKKDQLHKDHWDVTDPKTGKKVKEVDFNGNQIWPGGAKNKNKK
jgi:hypothetical protein